MSGLGVRIAAAAFALVLLGGAASAQTSLSEVASDKTIDATGGDVKAGGSTVTVRGQAGSVQVAGASVAVHAEVSGNLDAAGAEVTIDGAVGGNARLAGASVTLIGKVSGEVLAAGGIVTVTSEIGGQARIFGGQVSIGPQSIVTGKAEIYGGSVTFDGAARGAAHFGGGQVTVNGTIDGDLLVDAARVVLGPTAVVSGNLTVRSPAAPEIREGARISGTTVHQPPQAWWEQIGYSTWQITLGFAFFIAASTVVTGIMLMFIGRGTFEDAVTLARTKVITSFVVGLVAAILLPIIAAILIATIIGSPIGIAILLFLAVLIIGSYAVAAAGLADLVFNRPMGQRIAGRTVVFLIVGAIVLGLLTLIPIAGFWLILLLVLWGFGAYLRSIRRRGRRKVIPPVGAPRVAV